MRPFAQADRHNGPGLRHQLVPSVAAMIDQVFVVGEDAVGE